MKITTNRSTSKSKVALISYSAAAMGGIYKVQGYDDEVRVIFGKHLALYISEGGKPETLDEMYWVKESFIPVSGESINILFES